MPRFLQVENARVCCCATCIRMPRPWRRGRGPRRVSPCSNAIIHAVLAVLILPLCTRACYFPNGTPTNASYGICAAGSDKVTFSRKGLGSVCCRYGDRCVDNGLCRAVPSSTSSDDGDEQAVWYRPACALSMWDDTLDCLSILCAKTVPGGELRLGLCPPTGDGKQRFFCDDGSGAVRVCDSEGARVFDFPGMLSLRSNEHHIF